MGWIAIGIIGIGYTVWYGNLIGLNSTKNPKLYAVHTLYLTSFLALELIRAAATDISASTIAPTLSSSVSGRVMGASLHSCFTTSCDTAAACGNMTAS